VGGWVITPPPVYTANRSTESAASAIRGRRFAGGKLRGNGAKITIPLAHLHRILIAAAGQLFRKCDVERMSSPGNGKVEQKMQ
jgi:hypothetical protein